VIPKTSQGVTRPPFSSVVYSPRTRSRDGYTTFFSFFFFFFLPCSCLFLPATVHIQHMRCMPILHPYDRCMAITSLYVVLAALHVTVPHMPAVMTIQTLASIAHWLVYHNNAFHRADVVLSTGVFLWNVWYLVTARPTQTLEALMAAGASAACFRARVGVRDKMLVSYHFVHVLPHAAFRFFAFWFVMLSHGQPWSWSLSAFYWCTVFLLSLPYPTMPPGQSWEVFRRLQ